MQKIFLTSLGCKVNQCEIGSIAKGFEQKNFIIVKKVEDCDIAIVNTCAVTEEGYRKSKQAVRKIRRKNALCKIIVMGCASEFDANAMLIDENIVVMGTKSKDKVLQLVDSVGLALQKEDKIEDDFYFSDYRARGHLKVQDGCDSFCSYCIVPHLRGRSRSFPIHRVQKMLEGVTCKEVVLTGINLSLYGKDINTDLITLCESISSDNYRLRFGSLEVSVISDDFLERLKKLNVCEHFHLSLQSGSDKVLSDMNRHYTSEEYITASKKIKRYFPNANITTDVIVGFPTETEFDFQQTLRVCNEVEFLYIHIFPYSKRKGTSAENYPLVDTQIVQKRISILSELRDKLALTCMQKYVGETVEVVFETRDKNGFYVGHSREFLKVLCKQKKDLVKIVSINGESVIGE